MEKKVRKEIIEAHAYCRDNKSQLLKDSKCGCFYCGEVYAPVEIWDWVIPLSGEEKNTARCPRCGIDSVIGESAGYPLTKEFLKEMCIYWFGRDVYSDWNKKSTRVYIVTKP